MPEEVEREAVDFFLDTTAATRVVDAREPSAEDVAWLAENGIFLEVLARLTDEPVPRTGPAARRAIGLHVTSRVAQMDRATLFHEDMLRAGAFVQPCPVSGRDIEARAGFWIDPQFHAYAFAGDVPFFVLVSGFVFARTAVYLPTLNLCLVLRSRDWKPIATRLRELRFLCLRRPAAIARTFDSPRRFAAQIGFAGNIAHAFRDEIGGLSRMVEAGYLERLHRVFVGHNRFYGPVETLFPEFAGGLLEHLETPGDIESIQDRYLAESLFPVPVFTSFVTRSNADRVARAALDQADPAMLERVGRAREVHFPLLSVTIRTGAREWLGQAEGTVNIIRALAADWPDIGVVLDGMNKGANQEAIGRESEIAAQIKAGLADANVAVFDTIGASMCESLAWALAIDVYLAPHGAGMVKQHWLAGKQGVVHSNGMNLGNRRGLAFDGTDMEDANVPAFVSPAAVKTLEGSGRQFRKGPGDNRPDLDQYQCDWRALERLLRVMVARTPRTGRETPLIGNRPLPGAADWTPWLQSGGGTAPVLLQSDQRCSYGLYISPRSRRLGLHDGAPLIVYLSGAFQAGPPYALQKFADEVAGMVLFPVFPSNMSGRFDRLAYCYFDDPENRHDLLLISMLNEFTSQHCIVPSRIFMCGGSGGAQFVNRFMLLYPEKVAAASMVAPGSITRASSPAPWWVGMADCEQRFGFRPDLSAIAGMPVQIVVGDQDLEPTDGLGSEHWMDEAADMGETRVERANALAEDLAGLGADVELVIVPGIGHELPKLWEHMIGFLRQVLPPETRADLPD